MSADWSPISAEFGRPNSVFDRAYSESPVFAATAVTFLVLCVPVHSGTARSGASPYTCSMEESIKATVATVWVSVGTAGIASNWRSLSGWTFVSDLGVRPPLAMMWRGDNPPPNGGGSDPGGTP